MRRALRFILVMFGVGFLLNVVITAALGASIDLLLRPMSAMGEHNGVQHWDITVSRHLGTDCVWWHEFWQHTGMTGVKPEELVPPWLDRPFPSASDFGDRMERQLLFQATGLPWRSSWCEIKEWSLGRDQSREQVGVRGGVELPLPPFMNRWGMTQARTLPLRPIWPGLALNTLAYAFAAAGVVWFGAALRRLRRFKRGSCPRCRHAMHGDYTNAWPECGWKMTAVEGR